jgi:hypothetical protein
VAALLVFGQALVMGGGISLGMFMSATVQCAMPVIEVQHAAQQHEAAVPCDADTPTEQRAAWVSTM